MTAQLLAGPDAIEQAAPLWRELERRAPPTPFQRLAWARAFRAHLGGDGEPWVLLAGEPPRALLPLLLRRRAGLRVLELLGQGVSDYLGPIAACTGSDERRQLLRALGRRLATEAHRFDLADLGSLHAPGDERRALIEGFARRTAERRYEVCPVIDTAGSWDDYLAGRRRKFRANLKRAERRTAAHGAVRIACESGGAAPFDELVDVERESWKWERGLAALRSPRRRDFLRAVLASDVPHEVWTCRIDEELASFAIVLRGSRARYYYLPSFRARFPDAGTHLLARIVRDSFECGCAEVDLLQGDEAYKRAWAQRERVVHELALAGGRKLGGLPLALVRGRWRLARSERLRALRLRARTRIWKRAGA